MDGDKLSSIVVGLGLAFQKAGRCKSMGPPHSFQYISISRIRFYLFEGFVRPTSSCHIRFRVVYSWWTTGENVLFSAHWTYTWDSSDHFDLTHSHKMSHLNSVRFRKIIRRTIRFHHVLKLLYSSWLCYRTSAWGMNLFRARSCHPFSFTSFSSFSHSSFPSTSFLSSLLFHLNCCQLLNPTRVVHLRSSSHNHVGRQLHGGHGQPVAPYCRDCRFAIPAC